MKRNREGKKIKTKKVVSDPRFRHNEWIDWRSFAVNADDQGFDMTAIDGGEYRKEVILPKGTLIARYGEPFGRYTTLRGTKYESLSLPYAKDTVEYHEYKVIEDIRVQCVVDKGKVAPNFEKEGGAVQFYHKKTIAEEISRGTIREEYTWVVKQKIIGALKKISSLIQ